MKTYPITPVAKPRMTNRDKFANRPCVLAYWAYKDAVRKQGITLPLPCKVTFYLPMPESWSKKERAAHLHQPHLQTPDVDNLLKGLLDAIYKNDKEVWSVWPEKRWAEQGRIEVEKLPPTIRDIARKYGAS